MAIKVGDMYARLGLDADGFIKGIADSTKSSKEIKNTISVLGSQLKILKSEYGIATAGLEQNASQTERLALKSDYLKKQLEVQKQLISSLAQAHLKSVEAKGEDDKATQKLLLKLAQAKEQEVNLERQIKNLNQGYENQSERVRSLTNETGKFGSTVRNIFTNAAGFALGVAGFNGVTAAIQGSIGAGIDFNSQMQTNTIAFETMLGSADKAKSMVKTLSDMAASTPFEFPQLVNSTKLLLAFGFQADKIPNTLKSIGDASAGLGAGAEGVDRIVRALGQMQAKGKVSAEEINQLTEIGVPAWDILAKAMGKSTAEVMNLSQKGLIPANQAVKQLVDGMEQRFPNMMDKQSKSFSGLMSTLRDNLNITFGDVMKPTFEWLNERAIPTAIDSVGDFQKTLRGTGSVIEALRAGLHTAFGEDVAETVGNIADITKNFFGFITSHGDMVKGALFGIAGGFTAIKTVNVASEITNTIRGFTDLSSSTTKTGGVLKNLPGAINPVGLAVGGLSGVIGYALTKQDEYAKKQQEEGTRLKQLLNEYLDLAHKTNLTTTEKQRLHDVISEINKIAPEAIDSQHKLGGELMINATTLKALADQKENTKSLFKELKDGADKVISSIDKFRFVGPMMLGDFDRDLKQNILILDTVITQENIKINTAQKNMEFAQRTHNKELYDINAKALIDAKEQKAQYEGWRKEYQSRIDEKEKKDRQKHAEDMKLLNKAMGYDSTRSHAEGINQANPLVVGAQKDITTKITGEMKNAQTLAAFKGTDTGNSFGSGLSSTGGIIKSIAGGIFKIANDELSKKTDIENGGKNIGSSWICGLASGIMSGLPNLDWTLGVIGKRLKGNSPPPEGPLKDIDRGARNIAIAWADGFASASPYITSRVNELLGGVNPTLTGRSYGSSIQNNSYGGNTFIFNVNQGWDQIERELARRGVRISG